MQTDLKLGFSPFSLLMSSPLLAMISFRAKNIRFDNLIITTKNSSVTERVMRNKYLGIILMINTMFHLLLVRQRINFDLGINPSPLTFLAVLGYVDALYRHASASALKPLDVVYHTARFITDDALRLTTASCTSLGGPL